MNFPELQCKLDHKPYQVFLGFPLTAYHLGITHVRGLLRFPLSAYNLDIGVLIYWYTSESPHNICPHNHHIHVSSKHL